MKVRTDFVTNSSSTSYVIEFQLKNDSGAVASFQIRDSGYGVSGTREELAEFKEPVEALELSHPYKAEGDIRVIGNSLSRIESLEELIWSMLHLAHAQLYGGKHLCAFDIMPGAVDALARRCAEQGITLDNLRIIGGKIEVMPWGDSFYEVSRYIDQWGVNVEEGELRCTGVVDWRGWNTPGWKPGWQDTVWWPLKKPWYRRREASGAPGTWRRPSTKTHAKVEPGLPERATLSHLDISGLDTSQAMSMEGLFKGFKKLESLDLSSLDASQVTNMHGMFEDCSSLQSLDLSPLDTSQVTDMSFMFHGCTGLTDLTLTGLDTSQAIDMQGMFDWCSSLTGLDLSGLDTSQVTDMSEMLCGCRSLESVDLSGLDTSRVTTMREMFGYCERLAYLDLSGLDTSRVTDMQELFICCHGLRGISLSGLDTSRVTSMASMFSGCGNLKILDLSGLDTSQLTDMGWMFHDCSSLTSLDLSGLDTSRVTSMTHLLYNCTSLENLDLSGIDASHVTTTKNMFRRCRSLRRWTMPASWPVNLRGAIPNPTADNGRWWSERDGRWMTIDEIRARGPVADTFTSTR